MSAGAISGEQSQKSCLPKNDWINISCTVASVVFLALSLIAGAGVVPVGGLPSGLMSAVNAIGYQGCLAMTIGTGIASLVLGLIPLVRHCAEPKEKVPSANVN